ncbi:MAG: DUF1028 domain-containing protein [Chloroflexota bacterium]|nr:DUF1028 domain-containing protein [Chloroflexota bacterium]
MQSPPSPHPVHTYSIVARDPETGQMGVAVQSHSFSVGPVVPWAEAAVGAVATQSFVKIDYGPEGLALMREGKSAPEALEQLLREDEEREGRQVAMVDTQGNVAVHTGSKCFPAAGHETGDGFSAQANLMLNDTVWPAMKQAYEVAEGDLADRLVAALVAGQAAGGDIRGQQSAALLVVAAEKPDKPWEGRLIELRVEDHPHPVEELRRLVQLHRAYQLASKSDEYLALKKWEEAERAISKAVALAPQIVELRFWNALNLLNAGREEEALNRFRKVFAEEPIWADVLPRLVPAGLLDDDPELIERIVEQRNL